MLKWFSNDESGPNQAALESQEGSSNQSMAEVIDQLAQTQQLVSQLKELIREKDSNLKAKDEQLKTEKDSFEAKLSKLKLQNKAKVKSLNAQLEDLKKQLAVSGGKVEIKKSGGDGDQEHVSASLGMILLLKKKTEELELQLLQKEAELTVKTKELEAQRQRGMEMDAMLAENNRRLAEKEAYIIDLQMTVGGDITTQTHEPQVVEKKSAGEPASILELQLLVQHLTKKVEESEERYSLLQEQTESLKESLVNEKAQFEKRENTYKENKDNKLTEINHIHEQELFRLAEKSDASADLEQKDNKLTEINQTHEQELFRLAAKSDASADLEQALKQKLHEKEEVLLGKTQVINVPQGEVDAKDQKIKMASRINGQEALQAECKLMEESESEDSSAPEDCDTDEELCYFQDRLDPAVDDLSEDEAGSVSGASVKLDHVTASSPFSKRRRMSPASWNSEEDADVGPSALMFKPTRPPGVQLSPADRHTPQDLFKMFFSMDAVMTLCRNTNRRAALHIAEGKKYKWTDVSVEEFYRYIGLVFYMAMVKLDHMRDHWRQNTIFSQILPSKVMSRDRFRTISWNVHMSDPDEDPANDQKRGTPQHDRLFRLKPLMTTIQDACKAFYQPRRSLSVDERMVASKAKTEMTQYMKAKPTKWGFKLFVLADSSNGYTVDFSVYTGKNDFRSGQGLSYDSVMSLMNRHYLGCGYHLYMDNFYTSPKLLMDLFSQSVGACGTYRDNRKGCPRPTSNAISKNSARGTFRWIRDGPTVFVKWMDTREVSVCSTIHSAYKGDEVQRRLKSEDGTWTTKTFPCPSPVVEYNTYMGGVDLSDQLIQYYSAQQKSMKWYRKLFLHFLDIAATNAYILHKELSALVQQKPLLHKDFMEELIVQLCGCAKKCPQQSHSEHVPVPVNSAHLDVRKVASYGRRTCMLCRADGKQQSTPWKCQACDVPLCLQLTRNCFQEWHKKL